SRASNPSCKKNDKSDSSGFHEESHGIRGFCPRKRSIPSMKPGQLKLLELLKADEESGVIWFKHRRMLIFDADAIGLLRKELVETLGLERARRVLTRFGYACGYRDALTTKELFDWQSDDDWWAAGPQLHQLEGIVQVRMLRSHMDRRLGVLEAEAEWLHS